jgi:hypothetical protein
MPHVIPPYPNCLYEFNASGTIIDQKHLILKYA